MRSYFWVFTLGLGLGAVGTMGQAHAELGPPHHIPPQSAAEARASQLTTRAAKATIAGQPQQALELANTAIKANPKDAWARYDRADALQVLNRTDEAIISFREAQQLFDNDPWGKSVAMFGEARALSLAGRCQDAATAFERYAFFVEKSDPPAAAMARGYAKDCSNAAAKP